MHNRSNKVYTINSIIGVRATLYTGVTKGVVKKDRRDIRVGPKADEEIAVLVTYNEYEKYLTDQIMANYYAMDDFRLRMPDIIIQIIGDIIQGKPFTCNASLLLKDQIIRIGLECH
ncbi:unnamed protein product [Medioppia subpectinata]|uniref:Transglutaminase C-terminal domain-containing protein n=1 Tax=Medioppia subpectinata TaxID=1979941 RepID=A0A7R9LUQ0_9ACAR|nr:unnamed protein product [Medioppia subpectinata]CAG2121925.1 unnamed protein product [Medioppia subpectinata]